MFGNLILKSAECKTRKLESRLIVGKQEFCGDLLLHALDKIRRRLQVERHYNSAAQQTSIERRDPFRTILGPEEHSVADADLTRFKFTSKLKCSSSQPCVGPSCSSQSTPVSDRRLVAMRDTVIEKSI